MPKFLDQLGKDGYGGIVSNVCWHKDDGKHYLCEDEDFAVLDHTVTETKKAGYGTWLYDEMGYPSGSADGLTLLGHPEYEARGITELDVSNAPQYGRNDEFEQIIYACKKDGTPVQYNSAAAYGADRVYVTRPVFEGSHAAKCGWGPRRYPNLMDKDAIAAFIKCTYDRYFEQCKSFSEFEAVFTDEPSLMSGYVNCGYYMPYVFIPWQKDLPQVYKEMHGTDFLPTLPILFDTSDTFHIEKVRYWQTVAKMTEDAYFAQIESWCAAHHIKFSGHLLLEECISMHVPLYGDLCRMLRNLDYPGVDMLTGSGVQFRTNEQMQYIMAAKYVGSVARMTGKTEKVMVEICPIIWHNGGKNYSLDEMISTTDQLFMCGINHINSYLRPDGLPEGTFPTYATYAARAASVVRGAKWCGKIGLYYPIETMQGFYHPDHVGVNSGAVVTPTEKTVEMTMFDTVRAIGEASLDETILDATFIREAEIKDGALTANDITIDTIVMPAVKYLETDVLEKLLAFEKAGGRLLWLVCTPEGFDAPICTDISAALKATVSYGIDLGTAASPMLVSPLLRDGKRVWYVSNATGEAQMLQITLSDGAPFEVWDISTGDVLDTSTFTLAADRAVFIVEK